MIRMLQSTSEILAVYTITELLEFSSSWYSIRDNAAQLTSFQQATYYHSIAISYGITILLGSFGLWGISLISNINIFEYIGLLVLMLWLRDIIDSLIVKAYMIAVYKRHERKLRKEALATNGQSATAK